MNTGRWAPRLVALVLGAVLGMALGHGLTWLAITPWPDDAAAQQIAAEFVPDLAGQVHRQESRTFSPSGPARILVGFSEVQAPYVQVRFVVDGANVDRPHVEAVGERLRGSGWERVCLDPDYPGVTGRYQGLDVRFGAVLSEPRQRQRGPDRGGGVVRHGRGRVGSGHPRVDLRRAG